MAVYDLHWGHETRGGHKRTIHDLRAWQAVLAFAQDFRPQDFVFGGDILDCGAISHFNKRRPRKTEGYRLLQDAEACHKAVIEPIEDILPKTGAKIYLVGNHEDWIEDLLDEDPTLEGLVGIEKLLHLDKWEIVPQGGVSHIGKLYFTHGDSLRGKGQLIHVAQKAATFYERNILLGHYHTYQTSTKTRAVDFKGIKAATVVPCLCARDLAYAEGSPSQYAQGFAWGYVAANGDFNNYISIITDGRFRALGKTYSG